MESSPAAQTQTEESLPVDPSAYWSALQLFSALVLSIGTVLYLVF